MNIYNLLNGNISQKELLNYYNATITYENFPIGIKVCYSEEEPQNMIDDYLVSLHEMGMEINQAIDFLIINKILYMTGDNMVKALTKYSGIGSLKHTNNKLERME